ncbi:MULTISPECIES: DUF523 and DUF1722 domain-containing protein [unclassified Clostridium]|uniref:YbgA family protein n=1 Tax=unclassified Clostridium TaxID=2614128 RepID=UPI000297785A|nr:MULTISPECIES: DUF523 and DUF1722 domain-containing protein [unclassified Clostridium]EKQ57176.1 MAG: hypothetical protein A370_01190 [Clostridium sp. Maddingley MBC34-26]
MYDFPKPNIFISKCLGFDSCRYNGQMITDAFVEHLKPFVNIKTSCPEMSIGLEVPRDSLRVVFQNDELKLYQPKTQKEFTKEMYEFSESYLSNLHDIDGFLLKGGSPSCGYKNVKVYNGTAKVTGSTRGAGIFGAKIKEIFPYLPVEDEGRLHNYRIRDNFLTRIFINADFRKVKESNSLEELIHFQRRNKLLLMANSQKYMRILGRITGNSEKKDISEIFYEYEKYLNLTFEKLPKYTNNINVLMHAMGYFSDYITKKERDLILNALEKYRIKKMTIITPMLLVKSYAVRFNITYLLEQTYFNPYPEELVILEDSEKVEI